MRFIKEITSYLVVAQTIKLISGGSESNANNGLHENRRYDPSDLPNSATVVVNEGEVVTNSMHAQNSFPLQTENAFD